MIDTSTRVIGRHHATLSVPLPQSAPELTASALAADVRRLALGALPALGSLGMFATPTLRPSLFPNFYWLLVAMAILPALAAITRTAQHPAGTRTAVVILTAVWVVWAPLTTTWAPDRAAANQKVWFMTLALAGSLCLIGLCGAHPDHLRAMRRGWVLGFCMTAAIAVWELATRQHLVEGPWSVTGDYLVTGAFYNPNNYAGYLLSTLPFLVWGAIDSRTVLARHAHVPLLLLWFVLAVATQSRTALLGALIAVPLVVVWLARAARIRARPIAVMAVHSAIAVGSALWLFSRTGPGRQLITDYKSPFAADPSTVYSDDARLNLTRLAWQIFTESHGVGRGAGAFESIAARTHTLELAGLVDPHNTLLETAAEFGLPLLLPLLAVLVVACRAALFTRVPPTVRAAAFDLRMVILLSVVGFVAASLASSSVLTWPWWWLMLGQIAALGWLLHRYADTAQHTRG
ncbi:O-antigen ligase family protein [Micromonospora halotolerans]|uniref:O-antigen ligase family protein n=1 Tax=Micromonospora halotolerans TaxID=709879 RepID=A0ABY9ZYB5_9ACTN|nr:O-antigen ligase family protein [Micromonospora halotolerans]WNM40057.1 O-antigen ligase family protein [Micromonospora halotolerans]